MPESLARPVRMPCVEKRGQDAEHIRWRGEEQRLDLGELECRDNGGKEIGNGSRRNVAKQDDELVCSQLA